MHILYSAYILCYTPLVKQKTDLSPTQRRFWTQLQTYWPALKGSLALVHKPCIRPNCQACASGKKHPNYLLTFSEKGRRRCLYVPLALVPQLKRALDNGRRIEKLLFEMGPALIAEYRAQNPAQTGPRSTLARRHTKKPQLKS